VSQLGGLAIGLAIGDTGKLPGWPTSAYCRSCACAEAIQWDTSQAHFVAQNRAQGRPTARYSGRRRRGGYTAGGSR